MKINANEFRKYLSSRKLCEESTKLHLYRFNKLPSVELVKLKKFIDSKDGIAAPATINQWIITIIHLGHFIGADWRREFTKRKEQRMIKPTFTTDESLRFLSIEHESKYTMLFSLLFHTGARIMEVAKLEKSNVSFETGEIVFPKTKTGISRTVRIPQEILPKLKNYVKNCQKLLFPGKNDKYISADMIALEFSKRLKILGITRRLTPYSLRRTFITRNLKAGAPLFSVQSIVGHTNSNTTYRYFQCDNEAQDDVYKLDPLNRLSQSPESVIANLETTVMLRLKDDQRFNLSKVKRAIAMLYDAGCGQ